MADTQKSWFDKPEGKVGAAFPVIAAVAGGGALLYFWGTIVPWIVTMLENTVTAVALCAVLAAIGYVLFDPRCRNLMKYAYKSMMRAATGAFIELDPIGILKSYVSSLRQRLNEMDESIRNLGGQLTKLKNTIDKNTAERIHSLKLAQEAQKQGAEKKNAFILQSRQAGRLEKSNLSLQGLYDKMSALMKVLRKMRDASGILVEDIENEVNLKTAERASILAGYGAFTKARKIMQGGDDEREIFDMTMEHLMDDYGMKMGEIETFMDMSKGVMDGVDLDNGIYEADALAQLDAWEKKSNSLLDPSIAKTRIDSTETRIATEDESAEEFADLFDPHSVREKR